MAGFRHPEKRERFSCTSPERKVQFQEKKKFNFKRESIIIMCEGSFLPEALVLKPRLPGFRIEPSLLSNQEWVPPRTVCRRTSATVGPFARARGVGTFAAAKRWPDERDELSA
jgi:hypothetical protein